ncbi:MAG: TetR/AcrR family transcriptional regulator [Thermodesulfobacteriota bacterium]
MKAATPANGKTAFAQLKEQEKATRRQLIIEAAQRVFAAKPFGKVSMREIANEANISAPSIYTYFPDQETLFVEAALTGIQAMIEAFAKAVEEERDAGLEEVAAIFIRYLSEHDVYFRMMAHFVLHMQLTHESLERLTVAERKVLDIFELVLRRAGVKRNVRLLSHAFFATLNGILITFRRYPGRSEKEVLDHMMRLSRIVCTLFASAKDERERS